MNGAIFFSSQHIIKTNIFIPVTTFVLFGELVRTRTAKPTANKNHPLPLQYKQYSPIISDIDVIEATHTLFLESIVRKERICFVR